MKLHSIAGLVLSTWLLTTPGCVAPTQGSWTSGVVPAPDVPLTSAPYQTVHANWKQRMNQPYIFLDYVGDYRLAGKEIETLFQLAKEQRVSPSGPPFILFYDDPAHVPLSELRARIAVPVSTAMSPSAPLRYDLLPNTTVVYAVVQGPYTEVPRSYPGLYQYLGKMNWTENGPIREIYLSEPDPAGRNWSTLLCEVQIPATQRR